MIRWSGELMVSLMPMNGEVAPNTTVQFTCNYDYPDMFYIYFKLSPLNGFPVTARGVNTPGPITKTEKGAFRIWSVHVENTACNVECHIVNYYGKELIKIVTSITPGLTDCIARAYVFCPSIHRWFMAKGDAVIVVTLSMSLTTMSTLSLEYSL